MEAPGEHYYCVLATRTLKQESLKRVLGRRLPEGKGMAFYPCMEAWRGGNGGRPEVRAMFPGYVFVRSVLPAEELHEYLRGCRRELEGYIRELRLGEAKASGSREFLGAGAYGEGEEGYVLSDLDAEESSFLDFLLDEGGTGSGAGLLRMSYGYADGKGRWKVMEGPLRVYEGHIRHVDAKDRKAYLDIEVCGRPVRAGFTVRPKRHWFPEDKGAPEVLQDGTEVDLGALVRAMTGLKRKG